MKKQNEKMIFATYVMTLIVSILFYCQAAIASVLTIYHIDVDQGDATLFVSPSGNSLLVDSGKNGHGTRIKDIMDRAGITRINYFVCTHYHEDHYGGIDDLVLNHGVTVGQVYDRGDKAFIPESKRQGATFIGYENAVGARATHLTRGETIPLDSAVSVTCIASGGVVLGEQNPTTGVDENDMSIALLIRFGPFRYLIGGDIERPTEQKIADRDLAQNVDVYQSNHHGSHTASLPAFMADLMPTIIIISNGNSGRYKHPRQSTLDTYSSMRPAPTVFQTNKYTKGGVGGNVPDALIADLESVDADGTIVISVDDTAGTYSVSYRDISHTFQIKNRGQQVTGQIIIESLLPDPVGSDWLNEAVTLRNDSNESVSLDGWTLEDLSGRIWSLTGVTSLNPGASTTIVRNRMPMNLNNTGDTVHLYDDSHRLVDRFEYHGVSSQFNFPVQSHLKIPV